jgi:uroporphyrinogen decarboxylase
MSTPREKMLKTLRRQGVEQVPVEYKMCPSQVAAFKARFGHTDYETYFNQFHRSLYIALKPTYVNGTDLFVKEKLPPDTEIDPFGVGHSKGSEAAMHMTYMHNPLKGSDRTLQEIQNHPLPIITSEEITRIRTAVADLHKRGLAVAGAVECTIWEVAWYLRSMEDLMADMLDEDPKAACLLDRITALSCERVKIFAEAGCDIIYLGDDIGMQHSIMMSVPMWEEWLKPRLMRVIQTARAINPDILIYYHSCGYVLPFLEGLIDAGVDILNPVQPECMSIEEVYKMVGGRISFWGAIGTQKVLPFGTPEEVRAEVFRVLDTCGAQGGVVIAPTHLVEPEVPWENLQAMHDAAQEWAQKNAKKKS